MGRVRVALAQGRAGRDVDANVEAALAQVDEGARRGATYIQLPEYATYYGPASGFAAAAQDVPGPATRAFAQLARARGVTVHVGSLLERGPDARHAYNTSVVIGPDGEIVARYRKAHLFDVSVGDVVARESASIAAGDDVVVAQIPGATLGLSVCFDLRFPELYRRLALAGAQVLCVPAAFTATTGRAHWSTLLRARAIENHAFVAAAARAGAGAGAPDTWGHSMVVDPWGEVLAEADGDGDAVLVAELDLDEVERRRAQIDVLGLRRPDLY
ncbi:MAG TPA: carbon-nitrogen hydrolase family protein [Acidimicrobiales bacterium]|nr:carbon-nitrogen hydrolase family protein [Acidimicrobiales bacterium]